MNKTIPIWRFRAMMLSEQNRAPIESEFFRREDTIASIIRETIQNSLDAAEGQVTVRFSLSGTEFALPPIESRLWMDGLRPHLEAVDIEDHTLLDEAMVFIAIEDF